LRLSGNGALGTGAISISGGELDLGAKSLSNTISAFTGGVLSNGTLTANGGNFNVSAGTITAVLAGTNGLAKSASGTVVLSAANTYSGGTTVSSGTFRLSGNGTLGTGAISIPGGELDLGAKSLTNTISGLTGGVLSNGTLTANGGNFNVSAGTITAVLAGSNGLVKSGNGTVVLGAANTFSGSTSVQSGTLRADSANALGGTSNIIINNGGSFLVTADDAIGTNTGIELNGGTLAFGAAGYDGHVGALTLSADSILDLGTSSNGVLIRFNSINWSDANALLSIYNWTGTTQWQGGTGDNTDQVYFTNSTLSDTQLQRISFYSGIDQSSFVGNAFQITSGTYNREIIAVPEPETWATAVLLLLAGFWWIWRERQTAKEQKAQHICRNLVA
jgi:autotransporter-associated beta strand protein